jgi:hypothetical protein
MRYVRYLCGRFAAVWAVETQQTSNTYEKNKTMDATFSYPSSLVFKAEEFSIQEFVKSRYFLQKVKAIISLAFLLTILMISCQG